MADLVLFNGRIMTMDVRMPEAAAIAVRDGRIVALGEAADIEPLTNTATRLVDLDGRVVLPGLLDARDPDAGFSPPPCVDPVLGDDAPAPSAAASPAVEPALEGLRSAPVGTAIDMAGQVRERVAGMQRRGVTAIRFRSAPVSALSGLLRLSRGGNLGMVVQMGHIPPCGAAERLQLQQVMRDLLAGAGDAPGTGANRTMLRLRLDPTPAVVEPPVTLAPDPDGVPPQPVPDPATPTVTPAPEPAPLADPWEAIAALVRGSPSLPAQSARKAIRAFTTGAAPAFGLEREAGMLAPGMRADMIVLDRNPFESDPAAIAATEVLQTWFAGELVHGQAGSAEH